MVSLVWREISKEGSLAVFIFVMVVLVLCLGLTVLFIVGYRSGNKPSKNHRFITQYHCKKCDGVMSYHEKMQSHGCCHMCGFTSNSTVCDTNKVTYEYINGTYERKIDA